MLRVIMPRENDDDTRSERHASVYAAALASLIERLSHENQRESE